MSLLRWPSHSVRKLVRLLVALAGLALTTQSSAFQLVVIDPGHGGVDSGTSWHGLLEKTLTLDVAKRIEAILRENGITTVMTRRYDKTISLDDRAIMANRFPNSLLVSVHFNAIRMASISGYETFYRSPVSKQIAQIIQKSLKETVPGIDRGVTFEDFAVLTRTKGPAVLVECGFLSNREESELCNTPAHRQKLAEAVARGVLRAKPMVDEENRELPPPVPVSSPSPSSEEPAQHSTPAATMPSLPVGPVQTPCEGSGAPVPPSAPKGP